MSAMRVGVTGAAGFIGTHLVKQLEQDDRFDCVAATRTTLSSRDRISKFVAGCECIVHLAGVNRGDDGQIYDTNVSLTTALISAIEERKTNPHVIFASSTHHDQESGYGRSKAACERLLELASHDGTLALTTLVIPGVFGPGCKPFYNSVVATFCHQLAGGEAPQVLEDRDVHLVSVHQLVERIAEMIGLRPSDRTITPIDPMIRIRVSELLTRLRRWRDGFLANDAVPDLSEPFDAHLYATLLSYFAPSLHSHRPKIHHDDRGRLFEIIKLANGGQVFFSSTKPGVVRGNHYHTRKIEWFCVLAGKAMIRLRAVNSQDVHEFRVTGETPEFVSIPALYTHSIENIGSEDLLTMFWCSEIFDAANPDTIYERVA